MKLEHLTILLLLVFNLIPISFAQDDCVDALDCESSWVTLTEVEQEAVFEFAEEYKAFIHLARTELSFVREAIAFAEENGFEPLTTTSSLRPGSRIYEVNRDRTISLMVIGEEPLQNGFHVIGSHIDSPRLDLKGRPLYEDSEFALFQTNYHGGLKYHQWTNLPLALMGRVDKKDGTVVNVTIGLDADDPIFMIPELSPHVDRSRNSQTLGNFIEPEDLDPVVGHIPDTINDGDVVDQVLAYLGAEYGITRADLVSAELALVPAGAPRDMGFDRGLIAAYGQDDRLAAYISMRAVAEIATPQKTTMAFLVDNEEVGNRNNTGARSDHFADLLSRLLYAELGNDYREPLFRSALRNTRFISIDVNPGINPMNPGEWETGNAPKLGYGVNLKLYGQGNNANSEFVAWTRALLDDSGVPWQTATYRVGSAGGGTIGGEFSRQNIEVIDFGVPLLSIHTPFAVSSKIDVYNLYRAALAFYGFQE
ncbi:MAG: aminopeptidase 1 [Gammaproteobacteria bacterium]|nr:aminopeptidase 1 [Gammaproteobacteria bacterium]MDD9894458.1 aminopeptidase 1 [Gammaproteobacteria bacterium]MDD9958671.1 aminopeptidase 1 [Gammaproteobacteria bacterium]